MDIAYAQQMISRLETKVDRMIGLIGDKSPHVARADGVYDSMSVHW